MVRERRDGENVRINRAQGHLLDVAQGIGHGESALRIGIPDTYSHPGFRGDHLVGNVRILADAVSHNAQSRHRFHRGRLQ